MLCDLEIIDERIEGNIFIEPFDAAQLNTNSYDVRLGNWFYQVAWHGDSPVFRGPVYFKDGEAVAIPVGGTLLGMTKEVIGTCNCVVAELRSKSTTRRSGITVCDDAGFGDVGYHNHWTVELTAHVGMGMPKLIVGERFAQMVFFKTGRPSSPYRGQYNANDWPQNMLPRKYRQIAQEGQEDARYAK